MTEPLDVTLNLDGTWTLNSPIYELVSVTAELWAQLEASEHVTIDRRPPGDQGQPAVTYVAIATISHWLTYQVTRQDDAGYELQLNGYSERTP